MAIEVAIDVGAFTAFFSLIFSVVKYIRKEKEKKEQKNSQLRSDLRDIKECIVSLEKLNPISVWECEIQIVDKLADCEAQLGFWKNMDKYYLCRDEINQYISAFGKYKKNASRRNFKKFLRYTKEYIDAMRNYVL